jgi:hypothetical protein
MESSMRILSLAAVLLAACGTHPASPFDDLVVTVSVSPTDFYAGQATTVTTTVTNHGDQPRSLELNLCGRPPFVVTTSAGAIVAPAQPTLDCPMYSRRVELAPGQAYVFNGMWAGKARSTAADARGLLPPGTYEVHGSIWLDSGPLGAPVIIRITP